MVFVTEPRMMVMTARRITVQQKLLGSWWPGSDMGSSDTKALLDRYGYFYFIDEEIIT